MDKLIKASPSGWGFLKSLVELIDSYVEESENLKKTKQK